MIFAARTVSFLIKKFGENVQNNVSRLEVPFKNFRYSTVASEPDLNFDQITNGNKELEHKLKVLALEAEVLRQDGKLIPDLINTDNWKELLSIKSRSGRQKYLEYLFKLEKTKENRKAKAEIRKKDYEDFLAKREVEKIEKPEETVEDFALKYGLQHNNIFLRVYDTTINQMYNNKLIQAMKFGQKLIIDLGYDKKMTKRENLNCAKQVMLLFAENRLHDDPFDIHFCNANKDSELLKQLYKFIPTIKEPWFPFNLHECSYLEMFPKNQLVYLTPHVKEEVKEFDHDTIYIVGGIVDKVNQEPLSLAKAKSEGLKMAKLPLDRYVQWNSGSGKSLTLNQVVAILLDQKLTGNWEKSFKHIPRRKLITEESTIRAIDNLDSRKRMDTGKSKWSPSYNKVNFDKLNYNKDSRKEKKYVDVKKYFND